MYVVCTTDLKNPYSFFNVSYTHTYFISVFSGNDFLGINVYVYIHLHLL